MQHDVFMIIVDPAKELQAHTRWKFDRPKSLAQITDKQMIASTLVRSNADSYPCAFGQAPPSSCNTPGARKQGR